MDNRWSNLYKNKEVERFGSLEGYLNQDWQKHFDKKLKLQSKYFDLIHKNAKDGKPIIECGTGTGRYASFLASFGYDSYGVDIDIGMVELAKLVSNRISPNNPVKIQQADINDLPFEDKSFSVSHSHGVLEHFEDDQIISMINEQIRIADSVVFCVPSTYFDNTMTFGHVIGDERYLPNKKWREIIGQSNGKLITETGCHQRRLKHRIKQIMQNPSKILKPKAFSVFELEQK